jgi:hypothetical protein
VLGGEGERVGGRGREHAERKVGTSARIMAS